MVKTEAPALCESRRQQLLPSPSAGAPLLDSTSGSVQEHCWVGKRRVVAPEHWEGTGRCVTPRAFRV